MGWVRWFLVLATAFWSVSAPAQPRLIEVGSLVGVNHAAGPGPTIAGGGVAIFDYDRDGRPDLFFAQDQSGCRLYRNEPGGDLGLLFKDVSLESSVASLCRGRSVAVFDYDRDGWDDVVVGGPSGVILLHNEAGRFVDHTTLAGLGGETGAVALSTADVDRDGYPDLYVGRYVTFARFPVHQCGANRFYRNRGDGTFVEEAEKLGIADTGCTLASTWVDLDGDGALDLVVANDFGAIVSPNQIYRQQDAGFVPVGHLWGAAQAMYAMGLAVGDVDGDGLLDLFFTNIGRNLLLRNTGAGYADQTDAWGLGWPFGVIGQEGYRWRSSWGAAFVDLDLDGVPELYVASGYLLAADPIINARAQANGLFARRSGRFELIPDEGSDWRSSRGVAVGDLDGDGRPDLVVGTVRGSSDELEEALPAVYLSTGSEGRHHLALRLVGTVSASRAAGARVEVLVAGGTRQVRVVDAGGASHGSQHEATIYVGLGEATEAHDVLVRWPSGVTTRHGSLAGNAAHTLREPEWLRLPRRISRGGDALIEATPLGGSGQPIGPGRTVTFRASVGTLLGTVTDLGDGRYQQRWRAPDAVGSALIGVEVDGTVLPATGRVQVVGSDRTLLGIPGGYARSAEAVEIEVLPRDAEGVNLGPGHQVEVLIEGIGTSTVAAQDLDSGRYRASLTAPGTPGEAVFRTRVGGVLQARRLVVPIVSAFDPERSWLEISPAVGLAGEQVVVRAWLLDGAGRPAAPGADFRLETREGRLEESPRVYGSGLVTQRMSLPNDGTTVVMVRGWHGATPLSRPALAHVLAPGGGGSPALVDGPRSRVFAFHSALPADGRSTVAVLVAARDVNGGYLPAMPGTVLAASGGTWRGPTRQALGNAALRCLIAPDLPALVEVSASVSGVPLGGVARIDFQTADPAWPAVDGCGSMDAFPEVPEAVADAGIPAPVGGGDGAAGIEPRPPPPWVGGGGRGCQASGSASWCWFWWVGALAAIMRRRS